MRMRKMFSELQEMGADFGERKLPLYASSATYSIAIAMVPVVMLIVSLVQFLPITEGDILNYLREWMPEQVMTVVSDIITGIYSGELPSGTVTNANTLFVNADTVDEYLETGNVTALTIADFEDAA